MRPPRISLWRGRWDSNPRDALLRPSVFKTDALNRTLPRPRLAGRHKNWQAGQDLNLQPVDLEATALPIELPAFATYILPYQRDFGKSVQTQQAWLLSTSSLPDRAAHPQEWGGDFLWCHLARSYNSIGLS